jgi:hypothetical protein
VALPEDPAEKRQWRPWNRPFLKEPNGIGKRFCPARKGAASAHFTAKNFRHSRENCFCRQSLTAEYIDSVDKVTFFAQCFCRRDIEIHEPRVKSTNHVWIARSISNHQTRSQ